MTWSVCKGALLGLLQLHLHEARSSLRNSVGADGWESSLSHTIASWLEVLLHVVQLEITGQQTARRRQKEARKVEARRF